MKFAPDSLLNELSTIKDCDRFVVALSGGLDSMVVLHALHTLCAEGALGQRLHAIHVNHGLSPLADKWQAFCEAQCRQRAVSLETVQLDLDLQKSENLEERARDARYGEFESRLASRDCLLMGHHLDDQMETLLLRLMRGSGSRGMAAIPRTRTLGNSSLLRPLLDFERATLLLFATSEGIAWIEDDSNQSLDFDRNFLRHKVLPLLESRWPGYRESWAKSLQLSREASGMLTELGRLDLHLVATSHPQVVQLAPLLKLGQARQRNALQLWLDSIGFGPVGWQLLMQLTQEVIPARQDSVASIACGDGVLQRYKGQLYALASKGEFVSQSLHWDMEQQAQLDLPGNGRLVVTRKMAGFKSSDREHGQLLLPQPGRLNVRYRSGGEKIRLPGRPTKTLKQLLQEVGIAPWLRDRLPLLYSDERLVCVPGIGVNEDVVVKAGETGYLVAWQAPDLLYSESGS